MLRRMLCQRLEAVSTAAMGWHLELHSILIRISINKWAIPVRVSRGQTHRREDLRACLEPDRLLERHPTVLCLRACISAL